MKPTNDGGPAATIILMRGEIALVSPEDFERVSAFRWRLGRNGYVYRRNGRDDGAPTLLHRFVTNPPPSHEVHHANHDRMDNRRGNLEVTTASAHQAQHHAEATSARNRASRVHPLSRDCVGCGSHFDVHPDHRGRNRYCSRSCGNKNRRYS